MNKDWLFQLTIVAFVISLVAAYVTIDARIFTYSVTSSFLLGLITMSLLLQLANEETDDAARKAVKEKK